MTYPEQCILNVNGAVVQEVLSVTFVCFYRAKTEIYGHVVFYEALNQFLTNVCTRGFSYQGCQEFSCAGRILSSFCEEVFTNRAVSLSEIGCE